MFDIATYLDDAIRKKMEDDRMYQRWFRKLRSFFDKEFGPDWLIKYKKALEDINLELSR
jgi:hypothetical protein